MFSGIIEAKAKLTFREADSSRQVVRITLERPKDFDDIKIGDSIAVNGACLTVEAFDLDKIQFALGAETLSLLKGFEGKAEYNLERSLKYGDRVHGHFVTGHVDGLGQVIQSYADGECWQLQVSVPKNVMPFVWKKGGITLHGVSLTINEVNENFVSVCLVPETIKKTNLSEFKAGEPIHVEADYMAKAILQSKMDYEKK